MSTVAAQDGPNDDHLLLPIPTTAPEFGPDLIIPVAGADQTTVRQALRVDVTQAGSSSKDELARAVRRLPLSKLSAEDRQRVNGVVRHPSLYRRLPTVTCRTDPRVYSFFVENPDVAVSIWRVMGISDMQMRQVSANEYETDLKDGTLGAISVLHRSPACHLILCTGDFKSPLLAKPLRSTGLMSLQSQQWQGPNGEQYVTHSADVFVVLHSEAVEAVAKLISPMSFKMADKNFEEVTLFIRMMDEAMAHQPGWIERTAARLDGVVPGRDKELLDVASRVYVDARRRELEQAGGPVTLEAIRPPVRTAGE
jgi:hypothetical protein